MTERGASLFGFDRSEVVVTAFDGLVKVAGFDPRTFSSDEVAVMEKAAEYDADFVFFEHGDRGRPPTPQAFVFDGHRIEEEAFVDLHRRLWSWGGVPILFRFMPGRVDLFRCAHGPDFVDEEGAPVYHPIDTLHVAVGIAETKAWWDAGRIRNGTLWDDPEICDELLSGTMAAHWSLIEAIGVLSKKLDRLDGLPRRLRRRLLIICLLVAYLEERGVLEPDFFGRYRQGARRFIDVLPDGSALVGLLSALGKRFNGNVFLLSSEDEYVLRVGRDLKLYASLVDGRTAHDGQMSLWRLYSFKDLPIEVISHVYQLFVDDPGTSIYTPPALVRLVTDEVLEADRLDELLAGHGVALDPACGSGIFLVETFNKLVLRWRSRNGWAKPGIGILDAILRRLRGIDLDEGAIEVAAFSLCLALCDALDTETIRRTERLFPTLAGETLLRVCFFKALESDLVREPVTVVLGNPPFKSKLGTEEAKRAYDVYVRDHGPLPDQQLAYLFLHHAMKLLARGGIAGLLQQYGFLYNENVRPFRKAFIERWNVREILDFTCVRGMFSKGGADTKVVAILATANSPTGDADILHAVFRRSGRAKAGQDFEIDYYDLHWIAHATALDARDIWRTNLVGGGRMFELVERLKTFRTLGAFAEERGWTFGEGFAEGQRGVGSVSRHISGWKHLPSQALTSTGIDRKKIALYEYKPVERPRSRKLYEPPMLLVREQMALPHALWTEHYLTYKNQIVGFAAPESERPQLEQVDSWLRGESIALQAYVAGTSTKLFTQKATSVSSADILAIPFPEGQSLDLSDNERIVVQDVVDHYRDLVRFGDEAKTPEASAVGALHAFNQIFVRQLNEIYGRTPVTPLEHCSWPGVVCQPYVFGEGSIDWTGADVLDRLEALVREQRSQSLTVIRIARIYDDRFVFLIKPDRKRYWLKSMALRDADETLSDLRAQGF